MGVAKRQVKNFWESASCGESLYLPADQQDAYDRQAEMRYSLEPYIRPFAEFDRYAGKSVLEIGVGLGADHEQFARGGAHLHGVDLTERAIRHVQSRFDAKRLNTSLTSMDAEQLSFDDDTFDLVYSWGVLHHTPDTPRAIDQVYRVLKPGGEAKIMIYHKWSMIGLMLWLRYGLMQGRPFIAWSELYDKHLESPGTKAYTVDEAKRLFRSFRAVEIETVLTHGDLLTSDAGQRHRGMALAIAKRIWPRWLIRLLAPRAGLFMLIRAVK